jgi:hypothetical protein
MLLAPAKKHLFPETPFARFLSSLSLTVKLRRGALLFSAA